MISARIKYIVFGIAEMYSDTPNPFKSKFNPFRIGWEEVKNKNLKLTD